MNERYRQLLPHAVAMIVVYVVLLSISTFVFGYGDLYARIAIGLAVLFGYKPTVVALGYGPSTWEEEIRSAEK